LTLVELAGRLVAANISYAINLDGGSSSTLVVNQTVVNHPTCLDVIPWKCERPVATVLCVGAA
jgi:exopolysaccharide biosynthesis protein